MTDLRATYEDMRREIEVLDSRARSDEEMNRRCAGINDARDRLAKAPAQTFDDVLLKLQELEYVMQEWGTDTDWHEPLLRTARESVESLLREG
jgi:hypothetical protein